MSNHGSFILVKTQAMIYHKSVGKGDPIIILHGLFGTGDNWRTFAGLLKDSYRVILVDLRNHGRSFWSDEFSYELAAQDVIELLDDLDISKAHVLGHSMGGKVAMTLAKAYPERVDKLMIVDIADKKYARGHDAIFDAIFSIDVSKLENRKEAEEKLALKIVDLGVRQFLLKSLARDKDQGFRWKTNFRVLHSSYEAILDEVDVQGISHQALFIRGSESPYISEKDIIQLKANVAHSEFETIKAGHWIHAEKPKELFDVIASFLQ